MGGPNISYTFEMWNSKPADLSKIRVFGCVAYMYIPVEHRATKLDKRSKRMIFVGYTNNGYRLWDDEQQCVVVAKHVKFDEDATRDIVIQSDENQVNDIESVEDVPDETVQEPENVEKPKAKQTSK